jgi:hypothetical protein
VATEGDEASVAPGSGFGAEHLGQERLQEFLRIDAEAVAGVVVEPGAAEQVGVQLSFGHAAVDHERVGEDALARVPAGSFWLVEPTLVPALCGGDGLREVFYHRAVAGVGSADRQLREPVEGFERTNDTPHALAERVDPGNVVPVYRVAQDQDAFLGFPQRDVPERVSGRMQHPEGYAAGVYLVAFGEGTVDLVRLHRLVEPLGAARLAVPAVDELRLPAVGGDRDAVAPLQVRVGAGVVAVVVAVED